MTAITSRFDSPANTAAYMRGLAVGVVASLILAAAIVTLVLFATWRPAAGATPAGQQPNQVQQVDEQHPLHRGPVTVF